MNLRYPDNIKLDGPQNQSVGSGEKNSISVCRVSNHGSLPVKLIA
jgi:hypothetical protein